MGDGRTVDKDVHDGQKALLLDIHFFLQIPIDRPLASGCISIEDGIEPSPAGWSVGSWGSCSCGAYPKPMVPGTSGETCSYGNTMIPCCLTEDGQTWCRATARDGQNIASGRLLTWPQEIYSIISYMNAVEPSWCNIVYCIVILESMYQRLRLSLTRPYPFWFQRHYFLKPFYHSHWEFQIYLIITWFRPTL